MTFNVKDMQEKKNTRLDRDDWGILFHLMGCVLRAVFKLSMVLFLSSSSSFSIARRIFLCQEKKRKQFDSVVFISGLEKKKSILVLLHPKINRVGSIPDTVFNGVVYWVYFYSERNAMQCMFLLAHFYVNYRLVQESFKMNNL